MPLRRSLQYALIAVGLSAGAPLGWLVLRGLLGTLGGGVLEEVASGRGLYAYMFVGTAVAFGAFGALVGHLADRLGESNRRLRQLAETDGLTALKNARYFHKALEEACAGAEATRAPL